MKLNLNRSEFLDIIIMVLFYTLKDDTFMTSNPRYNKLKDKMKMRGFKSLFYEYWLNSDGDMKKEFNRFKSILKDDSKKPGTIFLYPGFNEMAQNIAQELLGKQLNENSIEKLIRNIEKE